MKQLVKVFPDYCSTGVWIDGANASPEELEISPGLQLALKYWHDIWEFTIGDDGEESTWTMKARPSQHYVDCWHADGRKLAELMSAENDKYEFVYTP